MFTHSNLKIKREQTALKNEREKGSLKPSLHLALTSVDWRDEAQMFPWAMATWKLLIRLQVRWEPAVYLASAGSYFLRFADSPNDPR